MNLRLMACLAAAGCLLLAACGEKFSTPKGAGGAAGTSSNGGQGGGGKGAAGGGDAAAGGQGGATSTGGSDVGGTGGGCVGDELYAPPVPSGWSGPFAATATEDGNGPPCTEQGAQLNSGLISTDDTCECACGGDLTMCEGFVLQHEFGTCLGSTNFGYPLPHSQCIPTPQPPANMGEMEIYIEALPYPGVCISDGVASFGAEWSRIAHFCSVNPDPNGCTNIPNEYDETLCIHMDGDSQECPAGYSNGCTLYRAFNDGRSCNSDGCFCNDTNVFCGGQIAAHTNGACNTPSQAQACVPFNAAPPALRYTAELIGACVPGGQANVQGQLTPTLPTRVCCTAPSDICSD